MNIVALQGSPRKTGHTATLLDTFLHPFQGQQVKKVDVCYEHIRPCQSCYACERKGNCHIPDGMTDIYPHLASDEIVVIASPIYFYSVTAQLKAVMDRCQTFWTNPNTRATDRTGVLLLTAGAPDSNGTGAKTAEATARIFFECIGAPLKHTIVAVNTDKIPVTAQRDVLLAAEELAKKLARN